LLGDFGPGIASNTAAQFVSVRIEDDLPKGLLDIMAAHRSAGGHDF
jgi:hypothetical protein